MALKEELLAYVPEDKRVEFAEKTALYDVLTDDIAFERVKKSQSLTDKIATPIAEARFKNFEETKLKALLEEHADKVRKEFQPKDETPEQKTIRELTEWKKATLLEKETSAKKEALRKKASELGFDPLKAERLYAIPDAEAFIAEQVEVEKAYKIKIEALEKQIKFGSSAPKAGSGVPAGEIATLMQQYTALMNAGRGMEAAKVEMLIQQKKKELANG